MTTEDRQSAAAPGSEHRLETDAFAKTVPAEDQALCASLEIENERLRAIIVQLRADNKQLIERLIAHLNMLLAKWELTSRLS